jgi:hypothetical protein
VAVLSGLSDACLLPARAYWFFGAITSQSLAMAYARMPASLNLLHDFAVFCFVDVENINPTK